MSNADNSTPDAALDETPATPADAPPSADQVKLALRKVKDPELNLNIVDLALVYEIAVDGAKGHPRAQFHGALPDEVRHHAVDA